MFGVGVGFGLGEFGSGGFALEIDASTTTMGGEATFFAQALVLSTTNSMTLQISADSSLSLDPAGVAVTPKRSSQARSPLVTAKPKPVQALRVVPQPVLHNYAIVPEKKREQ